MNKQINLTNTGGFPLEEDTLDFMQQSYSGALAAVAKLCGNKVIVEGVVVAGGNVSAGWIAYNGELIPFTAGLLAAKVAITTTTGDAMFEDGNLRTVYATKQAGCGALGDFDFSELVRLSSLQNIWLPGDLKQKYVSDAYIAANFDGSGYGLNAEKGWRILSSAVPDAAGKVLVNRDAADADFDECGDTGGAKTHTLLGNEQGDFTVSTTNNDPNQNDTGGGFSTVRLRFNGVQPTPGGSNESTYGPDLIVSLRDTAESHNNLQPYFVVLTLIKL